MIEEGRIEVHCTREQSNPGKYVVYWMQQSQRVFYNHALQYAIEQANLHQLPMLVVFCVTPDYVGANARHYQFMLEGLYEVAKDFETMGIGFVLEASHPVQGVLKYLQDVKILVMDKGYLTHQRQWRQELVRGVKETNRMDIFEIDTDLIVPVIHASDKTEYAARTIRPKLWKLYPEYDHFVEVEKIDVPWKESLWKDSDMNEKSKSNITDLLRHNNFDAIIRLLDVDRSVMPSKMYQGGYSNAVESLEEFFRGHLKDYKDPSPVTRNTSRIGMYLHFGQMSSLEVLKRLYSYVSQQRNLGNWVDQESVDGFIEQIFVRRELAYNYVYYTKGYDAFETMTDVWAYNTMAMHKYDKRDHLYSLDELIECKTHDPYWNEAMEEMVNTGYMHNYMRMYWCKKILEWSPSYQEAYENAIYLNNRYFIDGRDPNGYTGVAWCFGKHDHGWKERPIFGKLRYMNANGLKRKFGM